MATKVESDADKIAKAAIDSGESGSIEALARLTQQALASAATATNYALLDLADKLNQATEDVKSWEKLR